MKKKINITYKLFSSLLFLFAIKTTAQVGFFTPNPAQPLHIDAGKDNGSSPDATKISNDVVITSEGQIGVGVLNPVTRVDLRSSNDQRIIGLGSNTQSPSSAGGGAIRYNTGGYLEYSDGEQWIALPLTPPTKALVNASNSSAQSIPSGTTTTITGWTETVDLGAGGGDFDPITGLFKAPRDGFYLVSFNITLANGNIPKNTFIETAIESSQSTNNIPVFKTVNSYPAFQAGAVSNFISGNCNAIFNLKKDDTIKFTVKHNIGSARSILNDSKLNNLSISEL